MRRAKKKYSTTGKFVGANRLDKYWTQWATRITAAQGEVDRLFKEAGTRGELGFRCRWGHLHRTIHALERCQELLG